jgi:hypothetical protein
MATIDASTGYFEAELIENENMEADTQYKVTQNDRIDYITVPNETSKRLNDLIGA